MKNGIIGIVGLVLGILASVASCGGETLKLYSSFGEGNEIVGTGASSIGIGGTTLAVSFVPEISAIATEIHFVALCNPGSVDNTFTASIYSTSEETPDLPGGELDSGETEAGNTYAVLSTRLVGGALLEAGVKYWVAIRKEPLSPNGGAWGHGRGADLAGKAAVLPSIISTGWDNDPWMPLGANRGAFSVYGIDPSRPFQIERIGYDADTHSVQLYWQARAGCIYHVKRSTDQKTWRDMATINADSGGSMEFIDPEPPEARAFYRLVLTSQ